ncbi:hypothetical protein ES288_D03G126800v1 [Gossypium darwinii]|uniref:Protein SPIRAL1-like 1 n=1 Tax=Gossypium darwinii TaxID=34276 RepID=A0A5D2D7I2_GOSDA|nr:hypothetical protein ES288_D03G126800v1 [Gossypium darwinii]
MGRGVSSGGGQSSLGYLFGSGESPKPTPKNVSPSTGTVNEVPQTQNEVVKETPPPAVVPKDIPAGIPGNNANNYFRADGQNCGNFLTYHAHIQMMLTKLSHRNIDEELYYT